MRTLIFLLFTILTSVCFGQNEQVFLKLRNAQGKMITGDVTVKGFEKAIRALTLSSSGDHNTELIFTMPITGASGLLKSLLDSREELLDGTVSVMTTDSQNGTLQQKYTIKLEKISLIACTDSKGSGGSVTNVVLKATRIGWTYYTTDHSGRTVVSQKYGWDASTGQSWSNF